MALNAIGQQGMNPYQMYGQKPGGAGMDNPFTKAAGGEQSGINFGGAGSVKPQSESAMYGKSQKPEGEQFANFSVPEMQGKGLSFMQNGDHRVDQEGAKLRSIAIA